MPALSLATPSPNPAQEMVVVVVVVVALLWRARMQYGLLGARFVSTGHYRT